MFGLQKRSDGATGQAYYSLRKHFCSHFSHYFSRHVKQAPGPQTLPPLHHSAIWPISCTFAAWPLDSEVKRVWQGGGGGERERESATTATGAIQMSAAPPVSPVSPDLSERSSFKVSGRETEGWLIPPMRFSQTKCFVSERSNLASNSRERFPNRLGNSI